MSFVSRPERNEYFFGILQEVRKRSTCLRAHDAALIVKGLQIISTGYAGVPSQLKHCQEVGCIRERLGIESGTRHELCRGAHAESNAIAYAARYGISVEGAIMYCTRLPCSSCAKSIVNSGIVKVVYQDDYPDALSEEMLTNVEVVKYRLMLDSNEAADRLGVHRQTLCRWVVRGMIRPEKVEAHGKHLFSEEEIERFLTEEGEGDCYWWFQEGNVAGKRRRR
jgi:dCMP deaminase